MLITRREQHDRSVPSSVEKKALTYVLLVIDDSVGIFYQPEYGSVDVQIMTDNHVSRVARGQFTE